MVMVFVTPKLSFSFKLRASKKTNIWSSIYSFNKGGCRR